MIKNEHQYRITKNLVSELEESIKSLKQDPEYGKLHPKAQSAHISGLKAQLSQSKKEIKDYESLKAGKFNFNSLPSLEHIPSWLIKARIARGLNQEELANLLKLKKQQIQQYESTDYASASLTRIREIADFLQNLEAS